MNEIGNGKNFPPSHPGFLHKTASYLLLGLLVVPAMNLFMRLLNRTQIVGKKNISGLGRPWILMSNHVSLLDDLFLGPIIFFPRGMRSYGWMPLHAPEERNFYKVPLVSWFMRMSKSIPVVRGKGIYQEGVNRLIEAVRNGGILHIYPEGTRTRTGEIGTAKAGIGRIVYESGAPVVPMYHRGLERVLPIGAGVPRTGKRIFVCIGAPITFEQERGLPNGALTWRLISEKIMIGIREQQARLERLFADDLARLHLTLPESGTATADPTAEV